MLKKRLIFTLLYNRGSFMLSRNFRLQKVGDLKWLQLNYNFAQISRAIDELIVLDVSREARNHASFSEMLKLLTKGCFMPISAGGGIRSLEQAKQLLRSGADKVVLNSAIHDDPALIRALAREFGQQCLIGSVDAKMDRGTGAYQAFKDNGTRPVERPLPALFSDFAELPLGEIYLNSIDRDGTGQGYDLRMIDCVPASFGKPIIVAGGAGNYHHLSEGLSSAHVSAVATAHLFNFVGDGLQASRQQLQQLGHQLALFV